MIQNNKRLFTLVILNKDDVVGFKYVFSLINKNNFFEIIVMDGDSKDGSVKYFKKKILNIKF